MRRIYIRTRKTVRDLGNSAGGQSLSLSLSLDFSLLSLCFAGVVRRIAETTNRPKRRTNLAREIRYADPSYRVHAVNEGSHEPRQVMNT